MRVLEPCVCSSELVELLVVVVVALWAVGCASVCVECVRVWCASVRHKRGMNHVPSGSFEDGISLAFSTS